MYLNGQQLIYGPNFGAKRPPLKKDSTRKSIAAEFEMYFLTMIYPATSWMEIALIANKETFTVTKLAE